MRRDDIRTPTWDYEDVWSRNRVEQGLAGLSLADAVFLDTFDIAIRTVYW